MEPLRLIIRLLRRLFALLRPPAPAPEPDIITYDPRAPEPPPAPPPPPAFSWETQKGAYKLTRIMCDEEGLSYADKNIICACIYQESRFMNRYPNGKPVVNHNIIDGKVSSTDYGIVQVNDYYHIGKGKTFPSLDYVMDNPDKMVRWMIQCQQKGQLWLWSSFKFGHYQKWLSPSSPMWDLKT